MFRRRFHVPYEVPRIHVMYLADTRILAHPKRRPQMDALLDAAFDYASAHRDELVSDARELLERLLPLLSTWCQEQELSTEGLEMQRLSTIVGVGMAIGWLDLTELRAPKGVMDARAQAALAYFPIMNDAAEVYDSYLAFCGHYLGRHGRRVAIDAIAAQLESDITRVP